MRGLGAPAASGAGTTAAGAGGDGGAAGFSADDLERARASFRVLLEVACCLFPAREASGKAATAAGAAGAAGGLQTSVLLLLTRLCEESWAPDLLTDMILAAETHRNSFLERAAAERRPPLP